MYTSAPSVDSGERFTEVQKHASSAFVQPMVMTTVLSSLLVKNSSTKSQVKRARRPARLAASHGLAPKTTVRGASTSAPVMSTESLPLVDPALTSVWGKRNSLKELRAIIESAAISSP